MDHDCKGDECILGDMDNHAPEEIREAILRKSKLIQRNGLIIEPHKLPTPAERFIHKAKVRRMIKAGQVRIK